MSETQWSLDSCQCILVIDMPDKTLARTIQKCQLHKDLTDAEILSTVQTHNKSYNTEALQPQRRTEYARIKALGNPIKT